MAKTSRRTRTRKDHAQTTGPKGKSPASELRQSQPETTGLTRRSGKAATWRTQQGRQTLDPKPADPPTHPPATDRTRHGKEDTQTGSTQQDPAQTLRAAENNNQQGGKGRWPGGTNKDGTGRKGGAQELRARETKEPSRQKPRETHNTQPPQSAKEPAAERQRTPKQQTKPPKRNTRVEEETTTGNPNRTSQSSATQPSTRQQANTN